MQSKDQRVLSGEVGEDRGQYLKIVASGEIVKFKNFSEITQLYEVQLVSGKRLTIQSNRISQQVTAAQIAEFVRGQTAI